MMYLYNYMMIIINDMMIYLMLDEIRHEKLHVRRCNINCLQRINIILIYY